MALLPEPKCVLCGHAIDPLGPYFRTSGAFLPAKDPLIPYCDRPFHWECYADWPERSRFAQAYIKAWVKANRKNPFWWSVHRDDAVYLSVNPEPPVEEASVRLCEIGDDIRIPLARWSDWLQAPRSVTPDLQPLEMAELDDVLPMLRDRYPDDLAVVRAIDPDEKKPRSKKRAAAAED